MQFIFPDDYPGINYGKKKWWITGYYINSIFILSIPSIYILYINQLSINYIVTYPYPHICTMCEIICQWSKCSSEWWPVQRNCTDIVPGKIFLEMIQHSKNYGVGNVIHKWKKTYFRFKLVVLCQKKCWEVFYDGLFHDLFVVTIHFYLYSPVAHIMFKGPHRHKNILRNKVTSMLNK